ncbi:MAG: TetR/AcrR family transcriptional regulator [Thermodesulfobacteriota bacterium]
MKKDFEEIKKEKQSVIFDAALKVIKEKGFHQARISDIAERAGVSYGLVYHYFKNKQALFDEIFGQWAASLDQFLDGIIASDETFQRKLRILIHYFLDTYQQKPDLIHFFITQISRSSSNLTETRLDHFRKFFILIENILLQGQKQKILRSDFEARYLTYIFLGAMETFLSVMVFGEETIKNDRQKEKITDFILEIFLNGAKEAA